MTTPEAATEPVPARPERIHAVTLLCAESVVSMVGEVSRSLVGLGFTSSVITGSDARAALMNRDRSTDVPMIYVVCVQGDLKDTVLGPLRQALATHGGPNEHLFVAVLDLSLPLSMVGQVRRFAEALERAPDAGPDPLDERRQWREHSRSHHFDEDDTRSYRTVRSVDEPTVPRTPTGARQIITAPKPPRIEPTRKYRAITGPLPTAPRSRAKKRTTHGEPVRRRITVPGLETRTVEPESPVRAAPQFGAAIAPEESSGRGGMIALAAVVLVAAAGATYYLGGADAWLPASLQWKPRQHDTVARAGIAAGSNEAKAASAAAENVDAAPAPDMLPENPDNGDPQVSADPVAGGEPAPDAADAVPAALDTDAAEEPADADAIAQDEPPPQGEPVVEAPEPPDEEPEPEPEPAVEKPEPEPTADEPEPEPEPTADEPEPVVAQTATELERSLAAAIERRDVKVSNKYFVATDSRDKSNWDTAKRRCFDLEIDGVGDWRLPFRRELQLLGAIGMLGKGSYWSKTVDAEDAGFAFVYERAGRRLVSWEKSEPARVACVRRR